MQIIRSEVKIISWQKDGKTVETVADFIFLGTRRDGVGPRWEGGSGLGTRVHLWRIHVDVWQNQYNKKKSKLKKNHCSWLIAAMKFKDSYSSTLTTSCKELTHWK